MKKLNIVSIIIYLIILLIFLVLFYFASPSNITVRVSVIIGFMTVSITYWSIYLSKTYTQTQEKSPSEIIAEVIKKLSLEELFNYSYPLENITWKPIPTFYYFFSIPENGPFLSCVKCFNLFFGKEMASVGFKFVVVLYGKGISFDTKVLATKSNIRNNNIKLEKLLKKNIKIIKRLFSNMINDKSIRKNIKVILPGKQIHKNKNYIIMFLKNVFIWYTRSFYTNVIDVGEGMKQAIINSINKIENMMTFKDKNKLKSDIINELESAVKTADRTNEKSIAELKFKIKELIVRVNNRSLSDLLKELKAVSINPFYKPARTAHRIAYAINCLPFFLDNKKNRCIICWEYSFTEDYYQYDNFPIFVKWDAGQSYGEPIPAGDIVNYENSIMFDEPIPKCYELLYEKNVLDENGLQNIVKLLFPYLNLKNDELYFSSKIDFVNKKEQVLNEIERKIIKNEKLRSLFISKNFTISNCDYVNYLKTLVLLIFSELKHKYKIENYNSEIT